MQQAWQKRYTAPDRIIQLAAQNTQRALIITDAAGVYQLYAWDIAQDTHTPITQDETGVAFGGISPDGKTIYYHQDKSGDEIGQVMRVPFAGGTAQPLTPNLPDYHVASLSQSLDGRFIGLTAVNAQGYRAYRIAVRADGTTAEPVMVKHQTAPLYGPIFSYDAAWAVIAHQNAEGQLSLTATHTDQQRQLQEAEGGIQPIAFCPVAGDARLLCMTDAAGDDRPTIWDLSSGDRIDIPLPEIEGDVRPVAWSPDATQILLEHPHHARQQFYLYHVEQSTLHKLTHPGGTYSGVQFQDAQTLLAVWENTVHPPSIITLDASSGAHRATLQAPDVPLGRAWESVTFLSTGGASIQAWLCLPPGDAPFPLIVHAHGGPTTVQSNAYHADAQAWVDHGFAWMSVNYRGSTTFGVEHMQAIMGFPGHREVDDLAAAATWALENGITTEGKIIVQGASYGGYLALQALGKRPDLWAGGIAENAIADWTRAYAHLPPMMQSYHRALWGGTPDDQPDIHRNGSPITYVDAIEAPVLVIQATDDPRSPQAQMQAYADALHAAGKTLTLHWVDTAGHVLRAAQHNIDHMQIMLDWAHSTIG